MDNHDAEPRLEPLKLREIEILRLLAEGLSNREIAQKLFITLETVKWYNKQLYSKLGVGSRTQAVAKAREQRLLDVKTAAPVAAQIQPRHNLAVQLTSFVGREREIVEITQLLQESHLLTLTGPGGTGKTRLGLQVASALLAEYEHWVFFVDLAPISDSDLVLPTVATTLGVREASDEPLLDTLTKYFRPKQLLLVLDNFEHVLAAAPAVGELLAAAPRLRIINTSRETLQIYGEQAYPVPPLGLPDLDSPEPLVVLSQYAAVALFIQRARAAQPDFTLTAENAPAVAEICVRLDGLPLALELAAVRVKLLGPQVLLAQLESRFTTLGSGARDLPARQQTLRGAIGWSYDLLSNAEQLLLARLSVFQGGRTIEAVAAVCSPDLPIDVLDGLGSLLNKSLLRQKEGSNAEPRFSMLETIHEYTRERLDNSGLAEATKRRHAHYFADMAEQADVEYRTGRQVFWANKLLAEHDNLRAALNWSLDTDEPELAARLVGGLADFWY